LNDGAGCRKLGDLYTKSIGGLVQDYSEAKKYYMKACELNDAVGCEQYNELENVDTFGITIFPDSDKNNEPNK
jgi:TPR repeat protein